MRDSNSAANSASNLAERELRLGDVGLVVMDEVNWRMRLEAGSSLSLSVLQSSQHGQQQHG